MKNAAFILTAFASTLAQAEAMIYSCPQKILTTATTNSIEPDWESLNSENELHRNVAASVTQGHPRDQGDLKLWNADTSASYSAKHSNEGAIYKFEGDVAGGYWLRCGYYNTSASYTQRLPVGLKMCEIKTSRNTIVCQ